MTETTTHYVPINGSRRQRFRKNKVATAERQNAAVRDAYRVTGDYTKFAQTRIMPPALLPT